MSWTWGRIIASFLGLLVFSIGSWPHAHAQLRLQPNAGALYRWFDGLDFDEVRTGSFVMIRMAGRDGVEYGFVSGKSGGNPKTLDLFLDRLSSGTGEGEFASLAPVDFESFAKTQLSLLRTARQSDPECEIANSEEAFVMARACQARGLGDLSVGYFAWTLSQLNHQGLMVGGEWKIPPPSSEIQESIAYGQMLAVKAEVDRHSQVDGYRRIVRLFGNTLQGPIARRLMEALESVERPENGDPNDTEIDRLIKILPIEEAQQGFHPGACEIFSRFGGNISPGSPAHRLALLGLKAVPKLIAALTDRRLTHCTGGDRYPGYTLTVGDVVLQILENIAARRFGPDEIPMKISHIATCRQEAEVWWATIQATGELATLSNEIELPNNWEAAEALESKYPTQASIIIANALERRKDNGNRFMLLQALQHNLDEAAISALRVEEKSGTDPNCRIEAEQILHRVDRRPEEKALIAEFHRDFGDDSGKHPSTQFGDQSLALMIRALLNCHTAAALSCLTEQFANRSDRFREAVISGIWSVPQELPPGVSSELEQFLVSELDDCEPASPIGENDFNLDVPEFGDRAALRLSDLFPAKYHFKNSASRLAMKRQRVQFANTWRVSQNMKPLPLPPMAQAPSKLAVTNLVASVEVTGETETTSQVAAVARALKGQHLVWKNLDSLLNQLIKLPLSVNCCDRVVVSRDAPGVEVNVLLELQMDRPASQWPGPSSQWNFVLDGAEFGESGSSGEDLFSGERESVEKCLNASPSRSFQIQALIRPAKGSAGMPNFEIRNSKP